MIAHPGVVRAALERVVERDLEAEVLGGVDEGGEVVEGAELGVDRVVAAVGTTDGPGAAGVVGPGHERVVPALAVGGADRDGSAGGTRRRSPGRRRSAGARWRPSTRRRSAGTARTRPRAPARGRSTHRGCGADEDSRASGTPATSSATSSSRPPPAAPRACSRPGAARRPPSPGASSPRRPTPRRRAPRGAARPPPARARRPARAAAFTSISWRQVAIAIDPGVDHQLVEPDGRRCDRSGPPVVAPGPSGADSHLRSPLRPPPHPRAEPVVTVGDQLGRHRHVLAHPRPWPGSRMGCAGRTSSIRSHQRAAPKRTSSLASSAVPCPGARPCPRREQASMTSPRSFTLATARPQTPCAGGAPARADQPSSRATGRGVRGQVRSARVACPDSSEFVPAWTALDGHPRQDRRDVGAVTSTSGRHGHDVVVTRESPRHALLSMRRPSTCPR